LFRQPYRLASAILEELSSIHSFLLSVYSIVYTNNSDLSNCRSLLPFYMPRSRYFVIMGCTGNLQTS